MPTVKVQAGTVCVELEADEISIKKLINQGLRALEQAHQIEDRANNERAARVGGYQ